MRGERVGTNRPSEGALADQRDFLTRSIDDLEREHQAGEVADVDYQALRERYQGRLASVDATLAEVTATGAAWVAAGGSAPRGLRRRFGSRRARAWFGWGAAACFLVAAVLFVASFAGLRLPGEGATGSVSLSTAQQLQETLDRAAILGSEGQISEAVKLYDQVLVADPRQPNALVYGGWLVRLAGLADHNGSVVASGDASIAKAVRVAPHYPDGHALLGVVLYSDLHDASASAAQFRAALAARASANLVASVAAVAQKAFHATHELLPAAYRSAIEAANAAKSG